MLNTKDIRGYLAPLSLEAESLTAISIPGEQNTLPADVTATAAREVGFTAHVAADCLEALRRIVAAEPSARVLICGSLYLAGSVLRSNG
jgi:dihydrofolate synthase/folylpolyglutamate synthase